MRNLTILLSDKLQKCWLCRHTFVAISPLVAIDDRVAQPGDGKWMTCKMPSQTCKTLTVIISNTSRMKTNNVLLFLHVIELLSHGHEEPRGTMVPGEKRVYALRQGRRTDTQLCRGNVFVCQMDKRERVFK
jgi:hypothetical protein